MRILLVILAIVGLVFGAAMIAGSPDDDPGRRERIRSGEEEPPDWLSWPDSLFGAFAPRIRRFAAAPDGRVSSNVLDIAPGSSVERSLGPDRRDSRIAAFTLVEGRFVRIAFTCRPAPGKPCKEPNPTILCLVGDDSVPRPEPCPQGRARRAGSVLVGPGGGWIEATADQRAVLRLAE